MLKIWEKSNLTQRILAGLLAGVALALVFGKSASFIGIFGHLFVGALRAVAPMLVFVLVIAAICRHGAGKKTGMKLFLTLSFIGMFAAAATSVAASFMFPTTLVFADSAPADVSRAGGISGVILNLLMSVVSNPVKSLMEGNYIGILAWSVLLGVALQKLASEQTKALMSDLAGAVTFIVRLVINCAPIGIMGLVYSSIAESGLGVLLGYGRLIVVLVATMLFVSLVVNPLMAFIVMRSNPYPLVLRCLRDSGLTAFFTRSSAANIPVNMALCEKLGFDKNTYAVAVPLGATVNMAGAAVTISVMSLAAVHTLGLGVDLPTALLLCVVATLSACGASGIAGGSLMLIPLACNLFGISPEISAQVMGIGFIIGVVQDSCETALNSHSDIVYLGIVEGRNRRARSPQPPPAP